MGLKFQENQNAQPAGNVSTEPNQQLSSEWKEKEEKLNQRIFQLERTLHEQKEKELSLLTNFEEMKLHDEKQMMQLKEELSFASTSYSSSINEIVQEKENNEKKFQSELLQLQSAYERRNQEIEEMKEADSQRIKSLEADVVARDQKVNNVANTIDKVKTTLQNLKSEKEEFQKVINEKDVLLQGFEKERQSWKIAEGDLQKEKESFLSLIETLQKETDGKALAMEALEKTIENMKLQERELTESTKLKMLVIESEMSQKEKQLDSLRLEQEQKLEMELTEKEKHLEEQIVEMKNSLETLTQECNAVKAERDEKENISRKLEIQFSEKENEFDRVNFS
jgi:chromosome segregation ATPase